ncbi:inhibin alpha chain [Aulostomus maculatus]
MVFCVLFIFGPLWLLSRTQGSQAEELSREVVMSWLRERILDGLGLEGPPVQTVQGPDGDVAPPEEKLAAPRRAPQTSQATWVKRQIQTNQESSQIILFPSADSSCSWSVSAPEETTISPFTYYFRPSLNNQDSMVTSAHLWFYAGPSNSSAHLSIVTSAQQLLQVAEAASQLSSDGWRTYIFPQNLLASVFEGPFLVQVHCPSCQCHTNEPDKMPFLYLHGRPRGPVRSPRRVPLTIPWSPSALDLLQRPSQEQHDDCQRAAIDISFEELGWDNWIVHPKVLTFYYCHGNCSSSDRTTAMLGITQCCAPVPGTMQSLRITTTSDGGYSFKYETLPNIIAEECTCI